MISQAKNRLTLASVLFLLLSACNVGGRHTPDWKLEANFSQHEAGFETLLSRVTVDDKLEMLRANEVRYAGHTFSAAADPSSLALLGLTRERWLSYSQQLRELGIAQVTKSESGVEFRVDTGSWSNGDSYKGYEYSLAPPEGSRKASLDEYRLSENDRNRSGDYFICKPLKDNWYLYLSVNAARGQSGQ